jgi:hypothetical protein
VLDGGDEPVASCGEVVRRDEAAVQPRPQVASGAGGVKGERCPSQTRKRRRQSRRRSRSHARLRKCTVEAGLKITVRAAITASVCSRSTPWLMHVKKRTTSTNDAHCTEHSPCELIF